MLERPLLARQPILDRELQVFAYELLCRPVPTDNIEWQTTNGNSATTEVVISALHEIGMSLVTGGRPAFVNFTQDFLNIDPPMGPDDLVIELLEHIPANEDTQAAVLRLKNQGYRIAVDDFTGDPAQAAWLDYADIVKVDLIALNDFDDAQTLHRKYQREGLIWLAEKVETHEQFLKCKEFGYDLFQGYFFSRPTTLFGKRTPDSHIAVMELLSALNSPDAGFDEVVTAVRKDPQLSYRLMQMANSSAVNRGQPVTTVQRAATLLGLSRIRHWANMLALGKLSDKPVILQQQALFRGALLQEIANQSSALDSDTGFTLGLFSLLDAMMDMPLEEVCARIHLPEELTQALIQGYGIYGAHLNAIKLWEQGEASAIDWPNIAVTPSDLELCIERAINATQNTTGVLGS